MSFIIKDFRTVVFIFIVISTIYSADISFGLLQVFVEFRNLPKLLRRQSSGGRRFSPDCRRVTIQEYLTLAPGYG